MIYDLWFGPWSKFGPKNWNSSITANDVGLHINRKLVLQTVFWLQLRENWCSASLTKINWENPIDIYLRLLSSNPHTNATWRNRKDCTAVTAQIVQKEKCYCHLLKNWCPINKFVENAKISCESHIYQGWPIFVKGVSYLYHRGLWPYVGCPIFDHLPFIEVNIAEIKRICENFTNRYWWFKI